MSYVVIRMQQFVVPQFLDVEDKILGPITARQFIILLAAGMIIFLAFRFGDFAFFVTILIIAGGLALLFAFAKINGQTFHYFILNIIQTRRRPALRIWQKEYSKDELEYLRKQGIQEALEEVVSKAPVRRRHISDLALVVNTGGFYHPEQE